MHEEIPLVEVDMSLLPGLQMDPEVSIQWGDNNAMYGLLDSDPACLEYPFIDLRQATEVDNPPDSSTHQSNSRPHPEGMYLADLFQARIISLDSPTPWPPPKDTPSTFRKLLSQRPMKNLKSILVANHLLSTFDSYVKMMRN